jgi:DNA-binding transcriptional MerR regulator
MEKELTLKELAAETGVPERTIRYYISRGLLAPPLRGGRGAAYGESHKNALAQIRQLQAKGMMLDEIARERAWRHPPERDSEGTDREFPNNLSAFDAVTSKSAFLALRNEAPSSSSLPEPAVWRSYSLADDVVVMFRAGASPWRTKRLMSALSRFSEAIHTDADNNNQGGSDE